MSKTYDYETLHIMTQYVEKIADRLYILNCLKNDRGLIEDPTCIDYTIIDEETDDGTIESHMLAYKNYLVYEIELLSRMAKNLE